MFTTAVRAGSGILTLILCAAAASAQDVYYPTTIGALKFEGAAPESIPFGVESFQFRYLEDPWIVLDGPGEAAVAGADANAGWSETTSVQNRLVVFRGPRNASFKGRLYLKIKDGESPRAFAFQLENPEATEPGRAQFHQIRAQYYKQLLEAGAPGAAWFRHQLERESAGLEQTIVESLRRNPGPRMGVAETYDLLSGGRALSENLQLDRTLDVRGDGSVGGGSADVSIDSIAALQTREINFKALRKDPNPATDALAAFIPADQHAVFFRDFNSMVAVLEAADRGATPVLQLFEMRASNSGAMDRYRRQLCLEVSEFAKMFGSEVISSVAFTGGDPWLRMGSDISILFEARNANAIQLVIMSRFRSAQVAGAAITEGSVGNVRWVSVQSPDRSVCSYLGTLSKGSQVFVTNSLEQVKRLAAVESGASPSLATRDEYAYFRERYQKGAADESAFVVIPDAAIRRWCSPAARIGDSRRTRVAAVLAELHARNAEGIAAGVAKEGAVDTAGLPDVGPVSWVRGVPFSASYGSLAFLTPLSELNITKVTAEERTMYEQFRNRYQQDFSRFMDPIAMRFSLTPASARLEVEVLPLIDGSEFNTLRDLTKNARLDPNAGDPHAESLLHFIFAFNREASGLSEFREFGKSLKDVADPLGWLGGFASIYFGQSPFWSDLAKEDAENFEKFFEKNVARIPVAANLEVTNALKFAAFITALRAFSDGTAPGMVEWTQLKYKEESYIKVAPTEASKEDIGLDNLCLYYFPTPRLLTLSLDEKLIHSAIDRYRARKEARAAEKSTESQPATPEPVTSKPARVLPWSGESVALSIQHEFTNQILALMDKPWAREARLHSFANIPILNEWKRMFPTEDPVAVHERLFHMKLLCPGGGVYYYDETLKTMASSVFGSPANQKPATSGIPESFKGIRGARLGITFGDIDGATTVRATGVVEY